MTVHFEKSWNGSFHIKSIDSYKTSIIKNQRAVFLSHSCFGLYVQDVHSGKRRYSVHDRLTFFNIFIDKEETDCPKKLTWTLKEC